MVKRVKTAKLLRIITLSIVSFMEETFILKRNKGHLF